MNILYYADDYTWNNMGTKRSIYEELKVQGHKVNWINRKEIKHAREHINKFNPDQIWLVHTNLKLRSEVREYARVKKIPIIGISMSDPYPIWKRRDIYYGFQNFDPKAISLNFDIYVTNYYELFYAYRNKLPIIYNRTACDFRYHKDLNIEKTIQMSLLGTATHSRFTDKNARPRIIKKLREKYEVRAYGLGWPKGEFNFSSISGEAFLRVINRSHLGLDLQDYVSPLAHRMFEYGGCGVPVITARRPEVLDCFKDGEEIITYIYEAELYDKIDYYMKNLNELRKIGLRALERCKKEHNINHRVKILLRNIAEILK